MTFPHKAVFTKESERLAINSNSIRMGDTKGLTLLPMSSEWLRTNRVTVGNQLCQMLLFRATENGLTFK